MSSIHKKHYYIPMSITIQIVQFINEWENEINLYERNEQHSWRKIKEAIDIILLKIYNMEKSKKSWLCASRY